MFTILKFFFPGLSEISVTPSPLRTRTVKANNRTFTALSNNRTATPTGNRTRVV